MRGRVVRGEQLGRRLGYRHREHPHAARKTAAVGIFAVRVRGVDARHPHTTRDAVASLGIRPTVNGTEPLLEAHVFDGRVTCTDASLTWSSSRRSATRRSSRISTRWWRRCTGRGRGAPLLAARRMDS
jgi:FAD synthase